MFSRAGKVRGSMAAPAASMGEGAAEAPRSGLSHPDQGWALPAAHGRF